jgi:hypothetical protein
MVKQPARHEKVTYKNGKVKLNFTVSAVIDPVELLALSSRRAKNRADEVTKLTNTTN